MTNVSYFTEKDLVFKEKPTVHNFKDIEGQKFGRLTVVGFMGVSKTGRSTLWFCKCDCGNQKTVSAGNLKSGHVVSCGCFNIEKIKERSTTHGHTVGKKSRTYITWRSMFARCYNPNNDNYQHYGGRGITVCDRWQTFENFLADMGERSPRTSIERIDNDGNYEPGNCRYATQKEQCNNTRSSHYLTFNGKTQTISQWSDETMIKAGTIERRLNRYGWTIERALTT